MTINSIRQIYFLIFVSNFPLLPNANSNKLLNRQTTTQLWCCYSTTSPNFSIYSTK